MRSLNTLSEAAQQADALIFDCDGTLVDTIPAHLHALQVGFERIGLNFPAEWFHQNHSLTADALLQKFQDDGLGQIEDPKAVLAKHQVLFRESLHMLEEVSVIASIAREYKGKLPMAVASNGNRVNVEVSLEAVDLLPYFDAIVAREDVLHGKPEPDVYLEAAHRLNVAPNRCLVFEDSETGLAAGRAAGARVIDIREYYQPTWQQAGH